MKKVIGILGGLSPESTLYYYENITRSYTKRFGDYSYPKIIIYSVSFQDYVNWQHLEEWKNCENDMVYSIQSLQKAGADFIVIASNTMHYLYNNVSKRVEIPILNITDCIAKRIIELKLRKVGLLGTKFTMTKNFYRDTLAKNGIQTLVPNRKDMQLVHEIIYQELVKGVIRRQSRKYFLRIINKLQKRGAEGVILGCTEIPLLVKQKELSIHVLDSSQIHSEAALNYALE